MIGGKTGFTDNAGYCLASFNKNKKGDIILVVTLGNTKEEGHFYDTKALAEWTFSNYKWN